MVPLCSRNAHDQNVLVRRAQWGNHSAHDLKEYGERSRNARPQKALVGRAQSETPRSPALVVEKGGRKFVHGGWVVNGVIAVSVGERGVGIRWQEAFSCVRAWNVRLLALRRLGFHNEEY
jgi:hypothetical protein